MVQYGIVIVGAGKAGASAAVELRTLGWEGPITLIGEEKQTPYERPPLSKDCLVSEGSPSPVFILNHEKLTQYGIDFVSDSSVTEIDRLNRHVILSDGRTIGYERLLLATGARPRKLTLEGSGVSSVMYLRTFEDALALRSKLSQGKHVAIIGGGFIGLEVAASAIKRGCSVTLLEAGPRILMRGVSVEIAQMVEELHRKAGVEFKLGVGINRIEQINDGQLITLGDGSTIPCDIILAGIGAVPETTLAVQCGLEVENGVRVDGCLRTSDPLIYAAGDCCSFPHPYYKGKRIRLESWRNANDQGSHAARAMLGSTESFAAIPWFWSDQYDVILQVVGLADPSDKIVVRNLNENGKLYFHLAEDNKLVAAGGFGDETIAREIRLAEMLIEKQKVLNVASLENPEVKLKSLLKD